MAKKNNNYLWIGIAVVAVVILAIFLISNSNNNSQNEITCNSPYIKVGNECCLDENSNNICDNDETPTQPQEYCGDGICQSNEKAPDCSDCNAELRIENMEYDIFDDPNFDDPSYKRLAITNYDVTNLGDKVVVYPGYDLFYGYSDVQCSGKDKMTLEFDDYDCPGGCYYVVDGDKSGKTYQEDGDQLVLAQDEDLITPDCIYFIFHLKPYPESGIGMYDNPSPIDTWESPIINI